MGRAHVQREYMLKLLVVETDNFFIYSIISVISKEIFSEISEWGLSCLTFDFIELALYLTAKSN